MLPSTARLTRSAPRHDVRTIRAEEFVEEPAALPTYAELFEEWRAAIETSVKRSTLRHYDTAVAQWLRLPKLKPLSPSIALTVDELIGVLRLAQGHRYGAVIFFAALTGARLGECLGIQQGDVDPQRNTIHIQRQLSTLRGEGVVEETLKTPGSDRLLPRTPRLAELLERSVAERRAALWYLGHREAAGWYFLNTRGGLLSPRLVEEAFDELVERAGLAETYPAAERPARSDEEAEPEKGSRRRRKRCAVSFHDLRSTLLTQLGNLGVDETTRGRIAGHGPKNVTQRYDRSTAERMRVALTSFEELVFKGLEREEASC
jgi:integrase